MAEIDRVLIWGAGAMGALYASKLHAFDPESVCFLADGTRRGNLLENGLTVNGETFFPAVLQPEEKSVPFDLVIVALKHHHLLESLSELACAVGERTIIVSVMNGIDSEPILGEAYGPEKVIPTVALGMDALRENGQIIYTNEGKLIFGPAEPGGADEKIDRLKRFFDRARFAHEVSPDMRRPLWLKLMINVGVNQTSAVLRAPFGVFQRSRDARALMEKAMMEVIAVAGAMKIDLRENDLDQWYPVLNRLSPDGKTSMLQDVEAGRKTEVEIFAGKIVALGREHGVPTPVNDVLLRIIKVYEERLLENEKP